MSHVTGESNKSRCPMTLSKGIGKLEESFCNSMQNWNILEEGLSLPAAVLDMEKFQHNLACMEEFLTKFKTPFVLAPHGKTGMMPKLFDQVAKSPSTWGVTVASATQAKVYYNFGTSKILMANQLVGKRNMEIISEMMEIDDNFDFLCVIDSPQNVSQLGGFFKEKGQLLNVLLEYGPPTGGRTGVRNEAQETELLSSLHQWKETLNLVGVEFFEGVLSEENQVSEFLDFITERVNHLIKSGAFLQNQKHPSAKSSVILSGSGSVWFDIVAGKLTSFYESHLSSKDSLEILPILRPGCYMIHDVGMYKEITARIQTKGLMTSALEPALKIWAYVQSLPEPGVAILGFGRRDAGNDSGFPKAASLFRPGTPINADINLDKIRGVPQLTEVDDESGWEIFRMMDQHSFMRVKEGDDIQVGDILLFDIIHPCTTLDKWRNVVAIDNARDFNIVDVYQTFF